MPPRYTAPGAYVEERLLNLQATLPDADATALAAFVGALPQGPLTPVRIGSWSDFVRVFGGFDLNNALPYAVYGAFQNGARGAVITRVVGTGAVAASRTLNDVGASAQLTLTAVNPGLWGNNLSVAVANATTAGRSNVTVFLGGVQVEEYLDVSTTAGDPRNIVSLINARSAYLTAVKPAVVAPAVATTGANAVLAVQAATALTGGAAGAAPTDTQLLAARASLELVDSPLMLNVPGASDTVLAGFLSWAETSQSVFVVADVPFGLDPTAALAKVATLVPSSFGAAYYPNLIMADPVGEIGATRLVSAAGAMIGQYAATDALRGVFKAPAGLNNRLLGVVGVERQLTQNELGALNSAPVPLNAIRSLPGSGVVPMGARTFKPGKADKYIPVRRTLIYLRDGLLDVTRFAAFEPNDSELWEAVRDRCTQFLQDFYQLGGLRGATPNAAYYVKCDASLNGRLQIENGEVITEVGVALQYPAEFIVTRLTQFEGGSTATSINA